VYTCIVFSTNIKNNSSYTVLDFCFVFVNSFPLGFWVLGGSHLRLSHTCHAVPMPCSCRAHAVFMPCSCRSPDMPCRVSSHMPCRTPSILRQWRVLLESVTPSLLGPNISHNTLLSNTLGLRFSHNIRYKVSHPYKTTGKIIVLCILTFTFFYSKLEEKVFCTE
jgi:hypothetical protein